jgi:hypothetical protein
MFLAALILASKYLQDRNYSTRAWSKISGLKTEEIIANEKLFLISINSQLHVPSSLFYRWQDIVLKYIKPVPHSVPTSAQHDWKSVVLNLTPMLDII